MADRSSLGPGNVLKRRTDDKLKTAGRPRCQPTPHRRWSAGAARRPGSRRPDRGPCRRRLRVRGRKSGRRPAKRRMLRRIFSQPSAAAESRAGATPLKQYWVSVSVARNGRPGFHILAAAMSCGVWVGAGTLAATSATKSSTASHHVVGGQQPGHVGRWNCGARRTHAHAARSSSAVQARCARDHARSVSTGRTWAK